MTRIWPDSPVGTPGVPRRPCGTVPSPVADKTVNQPPDNNRADPSPIRYLDGQRLRRALTAGIHKVISRQEHLNRINVFPVPDGDTGTNLAFTLTAVLRETEGQESANVGESLTGIADAALDGARGNSGAIFAQFLQGVSDASEGEAVMDTAGFCQALKEGAEYAEEAMAEPQEGTILTVMRDFAQEVRSQVASGVHDFKELVERGFERAKRSLANTPKQLAVLEKAGVVDAGAQGFVDLLEGILDFIRSGTVVEVRTVVEPDDGDHIPLIGMNEELLHRFCTECVVTGNAVDRRKMREALMKLGASSLVIAGSKQKVRVHVHVDMPDAVFRTCEEFGSVSSHKADDMRRQTDTVHVNRGGVAVVTDSGADIPGEDWERLGLHMVPVRLHFGERSYLDKVSLTPREFYRELEHNPLHPKTSQPAPGDFRRLFQFLASHHDAVISINVSGALSGTCQAAAGAASRVDPERVHVVDSLNASTGQGLLVTYAAEAARAGMEAEDVIRLVEAMRPWTTTYAVIPDLSWAVRGGRVARSKKVLADMLYVTPILTNTPEGLLKAGGGFFGKSNITRRFAHWTMRRLQPDKRYRLVVGHCNAEGAGQELRDMLADKVRNADSVSLTDAGPAVGAHAGPGSLVLGVQEYVEPAQMLNELNRTTKGKARVGAAFSRETV
ncbi:MAG: DegV family protein [Gammaproteobacteria bacterium]|nr:MAG: DegV family protein [Gammaproteobacteria bacterium]